MYVRKNVLTLILFNLVFWAQCSLAEVTERQRAYAMKLPLLTKTSLSPLGSFRVPKSSNGESGFAYGGTTIAYSNGELLLGGHVHDQKIAKIRVPIPLGSGGVKQLPTAVLTSAFVDPTDGHRSEIGVGGTSLDSPIRLGGLLPFQDRLIGSAYVYYDGGYEARMSHFSTALKFDVKPELEGMYRLNSPNVGFVAGYMCSVPTAWQPFLGSKALSGQGGVPIISRTSLGPAAFGFNPEDLGKTGNTVPTQPLVYYPLAHPTLGNYSHKDAAVVNGFNMATEIKGVIFPNRTRSVLFFGKQALGKPCYGVGTKDKNMDGKQVGALSYCYDPISSSKGNHGYPYASFVWAYDANDLLAVKEGLKNPWDVLPYETWTLPYGGDAGGISAAAYDGGSRVFLAQSRADGDYPLIHVMNIRSDQ